MTPEEIQESVAKICGWTLRTQLIYHTPGWPSNWKQTITIWKDPDGKDGYLPKYTESLDACQEMQKVLTGTRMLRYLKHLWNITAGKGDILEDDHTARLFAFAWASPMQRCNALLMAESDSQAVQPHET